MALTDIMDMNKFKPRSYQQQIIEVCKAKNSIVYLPTGSGKTFIAFMVIRDMSHDIKKSMINEGGKRSLVLANTVCLAKQHAENLKLTFPFKIGVFTGEDNVDAWRKENWIDQFEAHNIVVATVQVVLDAVKHGFIKIKNFNVIVFDECHHARKEHPMHEFMNQFKYVLPEDQPRVIGLSGMLIAASIKHPGDVHKELTFLESTFLSTVVTVNQIDDYKNVLLHSTNPNENFIKYAPPEEFRAIIGQIEKVVYNFIEKLSCVKLDQYNALNPKTLRNGLPKKSKTLMNLFRDFLYELNDLGPYGGYLSSLSITIQFELIKRSCEYDEYSNMVKCCITQSEMLTHELLKYMSSIDDESNKILHFSSTKVRKLLHLLKLKFNDPFKPNDLQSLVFVKRRYTAKCLYHLLKEYSECTADFPIKPDFMVGANNMIPESIEEVLSRNHNKETLKKFKSAETNVICCSSVLEEGMDLQMTNLVIMFDHPETYRSYVQTKGRARVRDSDYIVLLAEDLVPKFRKQTTNYKLIDQELKTTLIGKTCDRLMPSDEDIEAEQVEFWEPYITPTGAVLNSTSSVSLLNRYASMMPNDKFTNTNVEWERIDWPNKKITVSLRLPTKSKLKQKIVGDAYDDLRIAKRSAAFKACVQLHKIGELNNNLMPIENKKKVEEVQHVYFPHWDNYNDNDNKNAGTRVNRRYHKTTYPTQLKNCAPEKASECYLYLIDISPGFNPVNSNNECIEIFHELLKSEQSYGILTNNKTTLPKLCAMKLFQSFGQINANLIVDPVVVRIEDKQELDKLRSFHTMLLRDLLKVWKTFFVFDGESYLIVPTKNGTINWPVVCNFSKLNEPRMMNSTEKRQMIFKPEDYLYKVINPVYRTNCDQNYIVTHIMSHMSPKTAFANDKYDTYREYFEKSYNLDIIQPDQFLIQVKGVSKELNLMFPGRGSEGKSKKYERSKLTQKEIYIPEICHNHMFPGDLWLKATLLPCVLHRIHYMLLAETLRVTLMEKLNITENLPQQYNLDIDYGDYDQRKIETTEEEADEDLEEADCEMPPMKIGKFNKPDPFLADLTKLETIDELPLDIDRNWTKVRQIDIDYYSNYVKDRSAGSKIGLGNMHISDNQDRRLMDNTANQHIQLILKSRCNNLQQKDLIKALTTSKAGDVFDMERFEVLGDGYLKFVTSLYLYKKFDDWHEGYLTTLKGKIVSNRNLFYCGNDFGVTGMLKSNVFQPRDDWLAPSVGVAKNIRQILVEDKSMLKILFDLVNLTEKEVQNGCLNEDTLASFKRKVDQAQKSRNETFINNTVDNGMLAFIGQQYVGDKIVADCVEAILGVCVNSVGLSKSLEVLKIFKIFPENENVSKLLSEQIPPRTIKDDVNKSDVDQYLISYPSLEEILGYKFKDRTFLLQALTHSTFQPNRITECYQQLEFLGDAVLDFLITSYIFEQCPKMDPGNLTDLRSALVNNITLSCITVRHSIQHYLLSQNYLLNNTIMEFVRYQQSQNHQITDQIQLLMNEDDETEDDAIASSIDVPKVLGDLFESIVGAVFLDSGMDLISTWNVIYKLMSEELHKFKNNVPKNIIRRLFEYPKASPKFYPVNIVSEDRVIVPLEFFCKGNSCLVYGIGKNKDLAKKAAAKLALQKMKKAESDSHEEAH